jgi:signal peptidase I
MHFLSNMATGAAIIELAVPVTLGRRIWRFVRPLLIVLGIAFAVRTFVGEASMVPTASMESTILVGDHIFLNKSLYGPEIPFTDHRLPRLKTVRRGDVVAFRLDARPDVTYLKRVVAIGGDRVEMRAGRLLVNGAEVREPYAEHRLHLRENMAPRVVSAGHLFVMGDNRDDSRDSRDWGAIPEANVIGEPLFIYWSYDAPSNAWLEPDSTRRFEFYRSIAANFFTRTRWWRTGTVL